ncbi:glycosyltransferase family 87 protein [Corynebacterium poyangense]|nr:glycosyltransferase family 87 protein [Corynebacterium poyangense]
MTTHVMDFYRNWQASSTTIDTRHGNSLGEESLFPHRQHRVVNSILWPLAIITILYTVFIHSLNRAVTDDFTTVYSALRRMWQGVPVYNENYEHVNPHYLYNPGATLLLSPLGVLTHFDITRAGFILLNAVAIILALILIARMVRLSLRSPLIPLLLFAAFITESVINTLGFSNINGVLLLLMAVFLHALLANHQLRAGLALGLAILIKPLFAPLLFLSFARGHWLTLISALATPVLCNLIAWPLVPGASDYLHIVTPYLAETRDYANASLPGFAVYFGMPGWMEKAWFLVFAALIAWSVIILLRWRNIAPTMWAFSTSGILLTGVFLLSSLGQMYYSMLLFPMIATVFLPRSLMHTWPMWLGTCLVLAPWSWESDLSATFTRWAPVFVATVGWSVIICSTAATLSVWWREEKKQP